MPRFGPAEASHAVRDERIRAFYETTALYFRTCDGPAAVVACDGDEAVAHFDRNGLRPLWFLASDDLAIALSEMTGTFPTSEFGRQRLLGPGETVRIDLNSGEIEFDEKVKRELAVLGFPMRPSRKGRKQTAPSESAKAMSNTVATAVETGEATAVTEIAARRHYDTPAKRRRKPASNPSPELSSRTPCATKPSPGRRSLRTSHRKTAATTKT